MGKHSVKLRDGERWVDCKAAREAFERANTKTTGLRVLAQMQYSIGSGQLSRILGTDHKPLKDFSRIQHKTMEKFALLCGTSIDKLLALGHGFGLPSCEQTSRPVVDPQINRPSARNKTTVRIGVFISGSDSTYFSKIHSGFVSELERVFQASAYCPIIESVCGSPLNNNFGNGENARALDELFRRYPKGGMDYLVTIGTSASEYCMRHADPHVPRIFIGVTDPIRSGLVPELEASKKRGNIAGIVYGVSATTFLEFLDYLIPNEDVVYVYSKDYAQDWYYRDHLREAELVRGVPRITFAEYVSQSDILNMMKDLGCKVLLGKYFLGRNLLQFLDSKNIGIVGNPERWTMRGGLASLGSDDILLGEVAAREILYDSFTNVKALSEYPILTQGAESLSATVNLTTARRLGITVPQKLFLGRKVRLVE